MGSLLRLANFDLKDAGLLSSGRSPSNAPALIRLAFDRLTLAVIATECGWPQPSGTVNLGVIPDANPAKALLTKAEKLQPALQSFPAVGKDGNAAPAPSREIIRAAILATSAVLKDLTGLYEVDLFGEAPAGRASPIRPPPVVPAPPPPPPKMRLSTLRKAAPDTISALTKPIVDQPPSKERKTERPPVVVKSAELTLAPTQPTATREVAGRSPIELTIASTGTTSTVFWALMDAWQVEDMQALALIGHPGGLTKKGTRPRFKLVGDEVTMVRGLRVGPKSF